MGLFSSPKPVVPEFTGLQIQTAVNVLPIPLAYGSPRVSVNFIFAQGFHAVAVKSNGKGGGKGLLGGGKGQTSGYKYFVDWVGGLCEGPVAQIIQIFDDQLVYAPSNASIAVPTKSYQFMGGAAGQVPISWLTTSYPSAAIAYKATCIIGSFEYPLDQSATLPQLNFVPEAPFAGTTPLNPYTPLDTGIAHYFGDADPAYCILDFLCDPNHGVGFPVAYIDQTTLFSSASAYNSSVGDAALSTYCQAVGFAWSVVLNNAEPASSILDRWMKNLAVAPVWTGAVLKFIPYWDTPASANPGWSSLLGIGLKYFTPNVTPLFDLTDDDFIQTSQGEDPIVMTRIDSADVKNVVRVNFRDRQNLYNDNVSEAKDDNAVELYGPRVDRMNQADEFTFSSYASMSAQVQLNRNLAVRNTYQFKLDWRWCILDPMDVVTITDSTLGLNKFPVRIRTLEEDEKGIISIVAEEFPVGAASATLYTRQGSLGTIFPFNQVPHAVNTPVIFEPTSLMLAAQGLTSPTIVLGVSAGPSGAFDQNWGGAFVWVSIDNVTYVDLGSITGPSRMGLTTAPLAAFSGANPDNTHTLSVDLTESNASLESVTVQQAQQSLSLCAIVDTTGEVELLAYTTATLTATNKYNLTGLYRGLFGTVACSHATGSQFLRIDAFIFEAILPPQFVNQQLYLKLQSFNVWNSNQTQDLSTCTVYTYTPNGSGTNLLLDPIIQALLAGQNVDLEVAATDTIDLNVGSSGPCAPTLLTIDLETL